MGLQKLLGCYGGLITVPGHGNLVSAMVLISLCSLLLSLVHHYFIRPSLIRRALLRQGLVVLPYRPIAGTLPHMKRLETLAQLSPMPSPAPHHYHLLLPRLFPLHSKILSYQDDNFVYWSGTQPTLLIGNPEYVKLVFSADVKHLDKPESSSKSFGRLLGNGLPLANGQDWHHQRSMLRPAFFSHRLKEMVGEMTTSASELAQLWEEKIVRKRERKAEVDVAKDLKDLTANILARTSFGTSYCEGKSVFEKQAQLLQHLAQARLQNSVIPGYRFFPTSLNRKCRKLEREIDETLLGIVKSRRKSMSSGESSKIDLLGLMLLQLELDEALHFTTQQVIDQCKTFFFLGHETVTHLLSWTMMLLALHQEWQEKARAEVVEICGKIGEPNADQLSKMKILGMVLNEALRLYIPVPTFGNRVSRESLQLGPHHLPAGQAYVILCLYIHTRKDLWGEDANEFNPDRFINGTSKACSHPYGFIPFGIGPRICIGQTFAILEAKAILAIILQRFQFHLSPNYQHAPFITLAMMPKHGLPLILECL